MVHLVKAMVFPVVTYGCESWTVKKAEHWRTDAFELWCWKRLLRVPWTTRRSNQSILKEISPGCSLEGLMLKLKLQYFGHLMRRVNSLDKTLMLGRIGGRRRRGRQRMRWHHWLMDISLSDLQELVMDREAWRAAINGVAKTRLTDWTELMAESKEELKSLLIKVKEKSEKVGLKFNTQIYGIWSHHFMANRWGISGNRGWLYISGLQNHCHEIKSHLLLERKVMTNLGSLLKSRGITLSKVHLVKAMVFPVVMYGCESWTIILRHSTFLMVQWSYPDITTGKTIALTRWIFVGKVVSLLFNTLSRIFVVLLSSYKCLLVSWL